MQAQAEVAHARSCNETQARQLTDAVGAINSMHAAMCQGQVPSLGGPGIALVSQVIAACFSCQLVSKVVLHIEFQSRHSIVDTTCVSRLE